MPPAEQKEYALAFFIKGGAKGTLHVYEATLLAILIGHPVEIEGRRVRLSEFKANFSHELTGNYQEQPSNTVLQFQEV